MNTYSSIVQFENRVSEKILGHEIPLTKRGDQAAGHTFEEQVFGKVRGGGVPDLQIEKHYDTGGPLNMGYVTKGWDYEIKTTEYVDNRFHVLRKKGHLESLIIEGLEKIRRLYVVSRKCNWAEDKVVFETCRKFTGIKPKVYWDNVQYRFSNTHQAYEVYFKNFYILEHMYKNIKDIVA